ncbi:MAG: fibrobacter succinogenes major paralogous domain-containing protein, partial [Bacteroidales bacterium]|nr:fibrobacter succinogenes major paralogous domain-containing protein [Bacteroidales bacterium]
EPAVKGVKGGFAVGGLTNQGKTLTPTENYFEVNRDSAQFLTPSLVSQGNITTQGNITVSGNITTNVGQADSTLTDVDGNTYQTVRIGFQQWMAENLKTTHYSDGTPIDTAVHVYNDWAYPDSINIYGRLYSGLAISSGNNVCPDGWHVPTPDDWNELFTFIAGPAGISDMQSRVLVLKKLLEPGTMMEGNGYWNYPIYPTNETGFTARPAGQRDYLTYYSELHDYAYFWSYVVGVGLQQVSMTTMDGGNLEIMPPSDSNYSFSVRCLQNP